MLLHQIEVCTTHGKILKTDTKTINVKYQLQHGMKILIYLVDCILKLFKIVSSKSLKKRLNYKEQTKIR